MVLLVGKTAGKETTMMDKKQIDGNGWTKYEKLVLHELQVLSTEVKTLREDQVTMKEDIAGLKIKSGIWGALGGLIPVVIVLAIWLIKTGI